MNTGSLRRARSDRDVGRPAGGLSPRKRAGPCGGRKGLALRAWRGGDPAGFAIAAAGSPVGEGCGGPPRWDRVRRLA